MGSGPNGAIIYVVQLRMRLVYTLPHHPRALRGFSILLLFVFVFIFCPTCVLLVFYFFIVTDARIDRYIHTRGSHTHGRAGQNYSS